MTLGDWIKKYRAEHHLSMQDVANACGFSKAYIGQLEKGINPSTGKPISPTLQTFEKIAKAVGMDVDTLIKSLDDDQPVTIPASPPRVKGVRIPILGKVVAGIPLEAIEDIEGYEEIAPEMAAKGEYFALRVRGKSMEPFMLEDDIVIVRKQETADSGDIVIVLVNGDEATVKEIKIHEDGLMLIGKNVAVYSPHFYNQKQIEDLPVKIIGKVVEVRRSL